MVYLQFMYKKDLWKHNIKLTPYNNSTVAKEELAIFLWDTK